MLFLCVPFHDWNLDGLLDSDDEWVEIFNASGQTVDISGWQLDDGRGGSRPFTIPDDTEIAPRSYLVWYGSTARLGLNNDGDGVRLLHPDGTVADRTTYAPLETNVAMGRNPHDATKWLTHCAPTPGKENCSREPEATPTRTFTFTTLRETYALPEGTLVTVLGSVTVAPCRFDLYGHEMVVADGDAGLNVYMEYPNRLSCEIQAGEQLAVRGVLRDHNGLRVLYPRGNFDVTRHYAPPREIPPLRVRTGEVGSEHESVLGMVQGTVSNGKNGDVLWLNDGTGMVELYADDASGVSFEGITRGSSLRVVGVVYQDNTRSEPDSGYHLRPRSTDDVTILELAEPQSQRVSTRRVDLGAVSVAQALAARAQSLVTLDGVVTVPPGVIALRDFWMQDASGGARIYLPEAAGDLPALPLHARVRVRGSVRSAFGSREIRLDGVEDVEVLQGVSAVAPLEVRTGDAGLDREGQILTVQGRVVTALGREIVIDDGSGELLVYIDANTRIRYPRLKTGDPARITGVLTRFNGAPELLPRFQSDVLFGVVLLPVTGEVKQTEGLTLRASVGAEYEPGQIVRGRGQGKVGQERILRRTAAEDSRWLLLLDAVTLLMVGGSMALAGMAILKYRTRRLN